jgi:hypothetical protein
MILQSKKLSTLKMAVTGSFYIGLFGGLTYGAKEFLADSAKRKQEVALQK